MASGRRIPKSQPPPFQTHLSSSSLDKPRVRRSPHVATSAPSDLVLVAGQSGELIMDRRCCKASLEALDHVSLCRTMYRWTRLICPCLFLAFFIMSCGNLPASPPTPATPALVSGQGHG